jgi:parvulin-like peptidyl-prolyl isomerase
MTIRYRSKKIWGALGAVAFLGIGYFLGQSGEQNLAAQQVKPAINSTPMPVVEKPTNDDLSRVVAYVHGTTALTRQEFGEYLIQRVGRDRVELFVNKRIIEIEAAKKGIEVSQVEIDAVIEEDCRLLSINKADFVQSILKQYGKTMFEWKEDVIKPRLMMTKMLKDSIKVDETDLKKMFENRFGVKAKAQVIIWPKSDGQYLKHAQAKYDEIRKSDAEFNAIARQQADAYLASKEGHVEPIARWSPTGDNTIEDTVFSLKAGQISRIIDTPVGAVVIKCNGFTEAAQGMDFDKIKADLLKEVIDQKITQEVPKLCESLKQVAKPVYILQPKNISAKEADQQIIREIEPTGFKEEQLQPKLKKN